MVVNVARVLRRVDCRVDEARPFVVRREGAREETVDVDFVVSEVMMEVSLALASSSSESGGGEGLTVLRRRFGEEAMGLETGTAEAERRVPAVEVRVARTIVEIPRGI